MVIKRSLFINQSSQDHIYRKSNLHYISKSTRCQSFYTDKYNYTARCKTLVIPIDLFGKRCYNLACAGMMELADVLDSKSSGSDTVRVRPPLPAPKKHLLRQVLFYLIYSAEISSSIAEYPLGESFSCLSASVQSAIFLRSLS